MSFSASMPWRGRARASRSVDGRASHQQPTSDHQHARWRGGSRCSKRVAAPLCLRRYLRSQTALAPPVHPLGVETSCSIRARWPRSRVVMSREPLWRVSGGQLGSPKGAAMVHAIWSTSQPSLRRLSLRDQHEIIHAVLLDAHRPAHGEERPTCRPGIQIHAHPASFAATPGDTDAPLARAQPQNAASHVPLDVSPRGISLHQPAAPLPCYGTTAGPLGLYPLHEPKLATPLRKEAWLN